jgi:hypothetical protein
VTTTEQPVIHFYESMTITLSPSLAARSRVYGYGDELVITDDVREASRDRNGRSWLDWLDTDADEYRRGERLIARRGPWPAGTCRLSPGSFEWTDAREQAVREAFTITDPSARAERRREIEAFYGPAEPTSRTHAVIGAGALQ